MRFADSGRSRGFGFATLASDELVKQAIEKVNGKPFEVGSVTRNLVIREATPQPVSTKVNV